MNIGVIGANGFIGRNLCLKYIQLGHKVYAFYKTNYESIPKECVLCPTQKFPVMEWSYMSDLDCLFVSMGNYYSSHRDFLNQLSLLQTFGIKLRYKKLIFISSTAVYGEHKDTINVNSSYNNPREYGMAKLAQEFLIMLTENYTIIRPTYIYGTGMDKKSLLPILLKAAITDKKITIIGNKDRCQDYLHIDDLTELCYKISIKNNNHSMVLAASGKSITNIELANMICKCLPDTTLSFEDGMYSPSFNFYITDTIQNFNWNPNYSIENWIKNEIFSI